MAPAKFRDCVETLVRWGFEPVLGATMASRSANYFSGTDAERLEDLQRMLDDPSIKAVLCARGGYGTSRIIDQLSFRRFRRHPKWLIGYSDITVLLAHVGRRYNIAALHAPMAGAFAGGEWGNPYVLSLKAALEGRKARYEAPVHDLNRNGKAQGQLVGGNLSLVAHLIGTRSGIQTKGRILFLEDVGEYLYNVDRMMVQLKRAGLLDQPAALVIGGFTDNKDTPRPFGTTVEQIIAGHIPAGYPVCFGFPVSHEKENYALKTGVEYALTVSPKRIQLKEV